MINTIISKSASANSKYIYKRIEKDLDKKERSFLIVPEQYTLQSDINLMDNISYNTVMDAKVLSFSSLSGYIIDKTGGLADNILSKNGKIILLSNILRDINDQLTLFKGKYQNIDFINDIESFITNIKDNNFDEEFFKRIDTDLDDEVLKLKFRETKLIFDAYQKEIADKYLDTEDKLNQVITRLASCDFLKDANFYFDKFDYVSDIKMDFIGELLRLGAKVNVALTLDKTFINNPMAKDLEIYDMANKFYYRLRDLDTINEINLDTLLNKNEDINHLCLNYEKYNPSFYRGRASNIHVLESISSKSEVENIALIIKKLVHENKLRYKDISIYISDESQYENEISKVFNRYNLPVFLDKSNKLSDNHIVKTWLAALRLAIYDFNSHDLSYFLRSNIFDFGEDASDKLIIFQNYIISRKIKGKMFLEDKYFDLDIAFYKNLYKDDPYGDVKLTAKINEEKIVKDIRKKVLNLLKDLLYINNKAAKTSEIVGAIYNMISNPGFINGINNYQNILLEEAELDNYNENDQVWDKFISILEELFNLMGERQTDLKSIYNTIRATSSDIDIGIIPPTKDHIIVTNFRRPRVSQRPINFALGLNDTFFPSKSRIDFLLGKDEKDKLTGIDLDLKVYEEDLEEREKLNLYKMMSSSEKIYFSFALSDKDGAAINKSVVLNGILRIFPDLEITDLTSIPLSEIIYSKELSQKHTMDVLWKSRKGEDVSQVDIRFIKSYLSYLKDYGNFETMLDGLYYDNDKSNVDQNISKRLYPKNHFNVTEIETYSKCPYRYFVNFAIKPSYDENYDVDARELGSIVHNSLEDVSRLIKDSKLDDISSEKLDELISQNFDKSIDNYLDRARKNDLRNQFILNNLAKNTKNNSKEVINQLKKGEFRVADVEVDFGYNKENDLPGVYVDDENYLRGRIDRIDKAENYLRIIDYKTGKKVFKIVNILNGLDLQLLVYMMSAKESSKNIMPIGSFYMPLSDELEKMKDRYDKSNIEKIYEDKFKMNGLIIKVNEEVFKLIDKQDFDLKNIGVIDRKNTDILTTEDEDLINNFAKNLVSKYIHEIKTGNIKLNPLRYSESQNECQYCDFKGICKFDESIDSDKYRDFDKAKTLNDLYNDEEE
ncbi:PD-(D/E)XK nuclease family protein [uncultured Anaerococcus sp.]|uniref:PD-(D/E)XK nuclease family protein n=1 Tax=uncultured Anaerococcus sp. TaxID=293428 RepID=UPI0026315289|nr:PD-(D/E)XK nuclease family protein [uncultured Anaerococcus sp.]